MLEGRGATAEGGLLRTRKAGDELARMAAEVRGGLLSSPRALPSKYLYDDRGSALYEQIVLTPEYYQTRTEEQILAEIAEGLIARTRPAELVELGSGAGRKIRTLLAALARAGLPRRTVMLDVNEAFLRASIAKLEELDPGVDARGIVGDFTSDLALLGPSPGGRLVLFFAGTLGNLHPREVPVFAQRVADQLAPGDHLLVGVDLVKAPRRLEAAYNDAAGLTAAFNKNILAVVNEKLGADFVLGDFDHVARYDPARQWIEMRVRARRDLRVTVRAAGLLLDLRAGEEIRTELSCKYTRQSLGRKLRGTGLGVAEWFTDPEDLFALALLERRSEA
jgi:L-histidine N-alpha-methyltransferase